MHILDIRLHFLIRHACYRSSICFMQLIAVQIHGNNLLEQILVWILFVQIDKPGGTGFLCNLAGLFYVEHTAADTMYQRIIQIPD